MEQIIFPNYKIMVYSALMGRIGNNLFQIAAGVSLAKQNNTDFIACVHKVMLPEPDNCLLSEYLNQFKETILRKITIIDNIPENSFSYYETGYSYDPVKYQKNIRLEGYFQSEKYFDKELIHEIFSIDNVTLAYIKNKYEFLFCEEITAINVRRGDFLKVSHLHPICSLRYFRNAIQYIGRDKKYLIISDDIDWCKKKFKGSNFIFVEDENPTVDLYLQVLSTNNIISNSSFSWWGAWLNGNPDKVVLAPSENWVGKYHDIKEFGDLIPDSWILISNPLSFINQLKLLFVDICQLGVRVKKGFISVIKVDNVK